MFKSELSPFVIFILILCMLIFNFACKAPMQYEFNGSYYEYQDGPYTWTEAQTKAAQMSFKKYDGHLVTITSQSEQDFISAMIDDLKLGSTWIGLYQEQQSESYTEPADAWKWVTGEALDYTNWYIDLDYPAMEPNNYEGSENYAQMYGSGMWNNYGSGMWNDVPESTLQGFIVEYEKN